MAEAYQFKPAESLVITYGEIEGDGKDPILADEKRLAAAAALMAANGPALKDVLEVMLASSNDYLNSKATQEQFVPLRHEMAAFADVYRKFTEYAIEHKKRTDNKAAEKSKADGEAKGEARPAAETDAAKSSV